MLIGKVMYVISIYELILLEFRIEKKNINIFFCFFCSKFIIFSWDINV